MRTICTVGNWLGSLLVRGLTGLAMAGLGLHGALYRGECYVRQIVGGAWRWLAKDRSANSWTACLAFGAAASVGPYRLGETPSCASADTASATN